MTTTAETPGAASALHANANACAPTGPRSRFLSRLSLVAIACASLAACGTGDDPGVVAEAGSATAPVVFESGMALELGEASVRQAGPGSAIPSKATTVARMDNLDNRPDTTSSNRLAANGSNPASAASPVADPAPANPAPPVAMGGGGNASATAQVSSSSGTPSKARRSARPTGSSSGPNSTPVSAESTDNTPVSAGSNATSTERDSSGSSDSANASDQPQRSNSADDSGASEASGAPPAPAPVATAHANRPFAADSPWNQPIPANATYRASDPRTSSLRSAGTFGVNSSQWTIWVWQAKASDPLVTVDVSVRHLTSSGNANAGKVTIRMPANAHADPELDSHMTILDPDGKHAHEFWYAKKSGGSFTAVSYAKIPLDGSGVNVSGYASHNSDYLTYGWGATRAYGGSQLGGLIRKGEVTQGSIEHAIAVAIPARYLGGRAVWPATSDDQSSDYAGVIPMGTRFAIPPSVNVESLGLSPAHLRLARALQKYGLIVVDKSGSPCMYAEGLEAQADGNALNANRSQVALLQSLLTVVE